MQPTGKIASTRSCWLKQPTACISVTYLLSSDDGPGLALPSGTAKMLAFAL